MLRAYSRREAALTCAREAISTWSFIDGVGWVPGRHQDAYGALEARGPRWIARVRDLFRIDASPEAAMLWVEDGGR